MTRLYFIVVKVKFKLKREEGFFHCLDTWLPIDNPYLTRDWIDCDLVETR